LSYRPTGLYIGRWNRFLGSLNVYKYGHSLLKKWKKGPQPTADLVLCHDPEYPEYRSSLMMRSALIL
jgi:hypothetical protein